MRIDDSLPPGVDWRFEWMAFVVKNRRELRIALLRDGYSTGGVGKWGSLTGVEIREFHNDTDAIAWLVAP